MAAVALQQSAIDARSIRVVRKPSHNDQHTAPAGEAISRGALIRLDSASGRWVNAAADLAANAPTHMAWRTVVAGESLTGVRNCLVDGFVLDAINYGIVVYAANTAGGVDTAAGTVSTVVGRVVSGHSQLLGVAADKLLDVGSFGH
jgi:hypothetical protein